MRIDLHTHSNVSDGTDTPSALMGKAREAGLDVIGLADHDTFAGLAEAYAAAAEVGVELVPAMEMSCELRGRSVHLLAYGADVGDEALLAELVRIREGRDQRLPKVLAKLAELGVPVSEEEVAAQVGDAPSIGRPHIADALVARGYVPNRDEAFVRWLADDGPAYVERYATELATGIELVHAAGGVAVIAHPWGRGSIAVLESEVLEGLVTEHGLDGFEVDHNDHDQSQRAELRRLAGRLEVLGTGSSDYHGLGKQDHALGCNLTSDEAYAALRERMNRARMDQLDRS